MSVVSWGGSRWFFERVANGSLSKHSRPVYIKPPSPVITINSTTTISWSDMPEASQFRHPTPSHIHTPAFETCQFSPLPLRHHTKHLVADF